MRIGRCELAEPREHRKTERRGTRRAARPGGDGTFCRSAIACFKFLDRSLLPCCSMSCFFWSRRRMMWATSGSWYMSKARSSKGEMDSHLLGAKLDTQVNSCVLAGLSCLCLLHTKQLHWIVGWNFHLSWITGQKHSQCGKELRNVSDYLLFFVVLLA